VPHLEWVEPVQVAIIDPTNPYREQQNRARIKTGLGLDQRRVQPAGEVTSIWDRPLRNLTKGMIPSRATTRLLSCGSTLFRTVGDTPPRIADSNVPRMGTVSRAGKVRDPLKTRLKWNCSRVRNSRRQHLFAPGISHAPGHWQQFASTKRKVCVLQRQWPGMNRPPARSDTACKGPQFRDAM